MNLNCKVQSELSCVLGDLLLLSELRLIVRSIAARVYPKGFGACHLSLTAPSSPLLEQSVQCAFFSNRNCTRRSRLLPDLTGHFTAQADDGYVLPLSVSSKPFRLTFILLSLLVRFTV